MGERNPERAAFDVSVAHPARRYNYWLGGKDNFAADRESADEFARRFPGVRIGARANRAMLQRATRHLAAEAGIRQFLDIGTGLPTADNTHEVAQRVAPESRIVYVDNDPLVMTHARALLTSSEQGRTTYIEADLREPEVILAHPSLRGTLDLSRPVALMLVAVLHFVPGEGAAQPLVKRLLSALPSGSYLVATHATLDFSPPEHQAAHRRMRDEGRSDVWTRDRAEFTALFDDLDILEPGVVPVSEWRPEPDDERPDPRDVAIWGAVGRKP
ncbi:methyltransferase [Plantactinospora sp. KBS50]|nr:methyltransferase [Plantactinospora sp. KBS50]